MSYKLPYFKHYEDNYDIFDTRLQHYVYDFLLNNTKYSYNKPVRVRIGLISKCLGVGKQTVAKALRGLNKAGIIEYTITHYYSHTGKGVRHQANVSLKRLYVGVDGMNIVWDTNDRDGKLTPYTKGDYQRYYMHSGLDYKHIDMLLAIERNNLWGKVINCDTIAAIIGVSLRTVRNYINEFVKAGLIDKSKVKGYRGFVLNAKSGLVKALEGFKDGFTGMEIMLTNIRAMKLACEESTYDFFKRVRENVATVLGREKVFGKKDDTYNINEFRATPLSALHFS